MAERRSHRGLWLAVAGVAVALVAGGVWYAMKAREDRRAAAAEGAAKLVAQKNIGLGRLENAEAFEGGLPLAAEAAPAFAEIAKARPDLAVGPRNLTIARLISLAGGADPGRIPTVGQGPATPPEGADDARQAVEALRKVEPGAATTTVLAARIAAVAGEFDRARAALEEAAKQAPDEAWVWYERYRLDRYAPDEALKQAAQDALGRAYQAAPRNVWIVREWLAVLADRQSPDLVKVIDAAKELMAPLAAGIEQRTRTNVIALLDRARAAAENGDWRGASGTVRQFANVTIREEQAQSDKREVDRNALEFAAIDFPPAFYEEFGLERQATPKAIPVEFKIQPLPAELGEVGAVRAVRLVDFDLDDSLDVAVLHGRKLEAFPLKADGGSGDPRLSVEVPEGSDGFLAADLDLDADEEPAAGGLAEAAATTNPPAGKPCHDADLDIVAWGSAGVLVFENRSEGGDRTLVLIEQPGPLASVRDVAAAEVADFDLDGDLDLVVSAKAGLSLWANVGGMKFEDRTPRAELPPARFVPTSILPVDLDRDVDLDLLLAGGNGPAGYLENLRHGNMRWRPCETKAAAAAVELTDSDGNASWDLLAAGEDGLTLLSSQTPEPGRWVVKGAETVADGTYDRLWQFDYDNDGLPDLLARREGQPVLLRDVGGSYEQGPKLPNVDGGLISADFGDFDADGDLDLALASSAAVTVIGNEGGNANGWLDVALLAQQIKGSDPSQSGRVNHAGLGSLLELKAGPVYQPAVVRKSVTHFGLGSAKSPDVLRVLWTTGIPQNVLEPAPKAFVCEKQSLKGSCPYLYTFDGEKFVFSTDLLWSAPIGLQFAEGVVAPTRAWEYLKIETPLRPDGDGRYALQLTEELWEAAYFDQVELIAVDHPPGVDVFTNEKVGPPDLAAPRLHTVSRPRRPIAAKDGKGRDVLPLLQTADDRYVRAFDVKHTQGLCEPHSLEIDFGEIADAERVMLYLTGWVYPSDTSLNVALGQRSDLPKSKPPSLSIPNERGEWVEVLPYMGFPGGKTKTIAIDLTGKFLCDDRRVRIDTTMELYWDAAFVTADEPATAVITHECHVASADLHYRGVSARIEHPQHGPERYDYGRVVKESFWPPMQGRFTRYGDVADLVREADDLQVVMSSGDEMTLRFDAPPEPPEGWTRSFVLHNVGYDKDADLNTVYGQTAEPLPFLEMKSYPYEPGQSFPDSPAHRRYLDEYQTRTQPQRNFWTAVRDSGN